jgi:nucleotide-binding universal stress UspA family protein
MLNIRTILCPTDLSESAHVAFKLACALARNYGAIVVVLHAYPRAASGAEEVDRRRDPNFEKGIIDTIRTNMPEHLGVVVEFRAITGPAGDVIVSAARNCDLVVMGTHGRTGLGRALLGSVAEQVLREAPCPVMTVRPTARVPSEPVAVDLGAAMGKPDIGGGD